MSIQPSAFPRSLLVALLLAASGCVARGGTMSVPVVVVEDGVAIEAEDPPAFVLPAGRKVATPFDSQCDQTVSSGLFGAVVGSAFPTSENYRTYGGTRRVRVAVPGRPASLHGVLAFCGVHPAFQGAVARSYRISVPSSYVDATSGGRRSVVYETYSVGGKTYPAWILWLAEDPFPAS